MPSASTKVLPGAEPTVRAHPSGLTAQWKKREGPQQDRWPAGEGKPSLLLDVWDSSPGTPSSSLIDNTVAPGGQHLQELHPARKVKELGRDHLPRAAGVESTNAPNRSIVSSSAGGFLTFRETGRTEKHLGETRLEMSLAFWEQPVEAPINFSRQTCSSSSSSNSNTLVVECLLRVRRCTNMMISVTAPKLSRGKAVLSSTLQSQTPSFQKAVTPHVTEFGKEESNQ
ncbi:hypothetical protein MDA_GLEAN10011962 [Myotis davidii]|uniref:Uncharacterized protein n=1 Tax=Myotis davidii TaxID=225400 RepID=L5LYC5_MYODS|nr:hypothetical protein MDA_GLEAN10011962 [Myotis davidii]